VTILVSRRRIPPSKWKRAIRTVSDADGRGIIVPEPVLNWLKEAAGANNIPYQLEVGSGGTTDASAIHLTKEGIPTGVISMPTRYIHTPVSVLSMSDLEKSSELIARAVEIVDRFSNSTPILGAYR